MITKALSKMEVVKFKRYKLTLIIVCDSSEEYQDLLKEYPNDYEEVRKHFNTSRK